MLTKKECEKALDYFLDEIIIDDFLSKTDRENYSILEQLIEEHFDNPPLEWEELKECNVVYDKEQKKYRLIEDILESGKRIVFTNTIDSLITENYESNRFYRKEVQE